MTYSHAFEVANPSSYERTDYVCVNLASLGVPPELDAQSLRLLRVEAGREVPYQIDRIFGSTFPVRQLTFLSAQTPPGPEDYSRPTASFILEERSPQFKQPALGKHLSVEHFYVTSQGTHGDVGDTHWQPSGSCHGVKLHNGTLEVYFSLVPHPRFPNTPNYSGAATSLVHHQAQALLRSGDMLKPFWGMDEARARWGQITRVDFYPLPWERKWYHSETLGEDTQYDLVWSQAGPVRAVVALRSRPITLRYTGAPYFTPATVDVTAHLFRVISLEPTKPFYTERVVVQTTDGLALAFRAHFYSFLAYHDFVPLTVARFESIPDYFAVWRHLSHEYRGYGFASNSHVRAISTTATDISWRLQIGHHHQCVHLFDFAGHRPSRSVPLHRSPRVVRARLQATPSGAIGAVSRFVGFRRPSRGGRHDCFERARGDTHGLCRYRL